MTEIRLPLALSLAAHAIVLTLLVLLPVAPPPAEPPLAAGIEVAFAPTLPQPPPPAQPAKVEPPPPAPAPPPPPPAPQVEKPPPAPPLAMTEPPPAAPQAEVVVPEALPLPPPPKPPVPPRRREVVRHIERPVERREQPRPNFAAVPAARVAPAFRAAPLPPTTMAPPQEAALAPARVPAPPHSTAVNPGYEALLGEWLNAHKRYPEGARERGEEGRAVLHFTVERDGRVTEYAVVKSSGYADLDAGLEEMMRGASLPPFPADMPQSTISVSVTIRFSLER